MVFLQVFACTEIFLLTVMSYDWYMAFCKPLRNMTVMTWKVCVLLALARWMGSTIHSISLTSLIIKLLHCGPDETDSSSWMCLSDQTGLHGHSHN